MSLRPNITNLKFLVRLNFKHLTLLLVTVFSSTLLVPRKALALNFCYFFYQTKIKKENPADVIDFQDFSKRIKNKKPPVPQKKSTPTNEQIEYLQKRRSIVERITKEIVQIKDNQSWDQTSENEVIILKRIITGFMSDLEQYRGLVDNESTEFIEFEKAVGILLRTVDAYDVFANFEAHGRSSIPKPNTRHVTLPYTFKREEILDLTDKINQLANDDFKSNKKGSFSRPELLAEFQEIFQKTNHILTDVLADPHVYEMDLTYLLKLIGSLSALEQSVPFQNLIQPEKIWFRPKSSPTTQPIFDETHRFTLLANKIRRIEVGLPPTLLSSFNKRNVIGELKLILLNFQEITLYSFYGYRSDLPQLIRAFSNTIGFLKSLRPDENIPTSLLDQLSSTIYIIKIKISAYPEKKNILTFLTRTNLEVDYSNTLNSKILEANSLLDQLYSKKEI